MLRNVSHLFTILILVTTSFTTSASDILDCVIDKYSQPNNPSIGLANPAEQGDYKYSIIHYGEQPFFIAISKPDIISPNVDLPDFLSDYSRNQEYKYDAYHRFSSSNLPLNAKVWLPQGTQPLPLVLLVHGNSAPGFNYLGELLASRGHIVVQVDQTYLNGLWGENGARGWILLEHLKLLRKWNAEQGHTFFNKINFANLALIGMSRGGEAVALAASFNQLKTIPNSNEPTEFGFNIKSVVALAPMDGQYQHAEGRNTLKNVNYLILQGGHDADVYQFLGNQQWQRVHFDDGKDYLKQSIYIYRANHINFNQNMSDDFHWGRSKNFYAKLLSPQQQEQITKVFVSAFLEATLAGKKEYIRTLSHPVINEYDLPKDIYVTRYMSSDFRVLRDFQGSPQEGDTFKVLTDKTLTTHPFNIVSERLRGGTNTPNKVLKIDLKSQTETRLSFKLPNTEFLTNKKEKRFLSLAIARVDAGENQNCSSYNLLTDTRIEIVNNMGVVLNKKLSPQASISPLLISDFSELENSDVKFAPTEPTMQTITLPIQFNKKINEEDNLALNIIFTPKHDVSIMLDDIGVTSSP